MRRLAAAILVSLIAGSASADTRSGVTDDGVIRVVAGERVVVRLGETGQPELVTVEAVDEGAARPPRPGEGRFADPPQGSLVLVLGREGERLHLKLESGVERAFDYRARLVTGKGSRQVSACTVLPLLANYERWPAQGAAAVEISDIRFRDTNEVVCFPRAGPK